MSLFAYLRQHVRTNICNLQGYVTLVIPKFWIGGLSYRYGRLLKFNLITLADCQGKNSAQHLKDILHIVRFEVLFLLSPLEMIILLEH